MPTRYGVAALLLVARLAPAQSYQLTTIAGTDWIVEGRLATAVALRGLSAVEQDDAGNLYIALKTDRRVIKVDTNARVSVVAGTGQRGATGDGGPAKQATLDTPIALRLDGKGNLYIADIGNMLVRSVNLSTGVISKVAGNAYNSKFFGDGGPATQAGIGPRDIAVDAAGNLYIADWANTRIRLVSAVDATMSTLARGVVSQQAELRLNQLA